MRAYRARLAAGSVYGLETIWDDSLMEQPEVYFEAGAYKKQALHLQRYPLISLGDTRWGEPPRIEILYFEGMR